MSRNALPNLSATLVLVPVLLACVSVASSMPLLMDRYDEHPLSRPENRGACTLCHVYADGSGPLTSFGKRYDRVGLEFTDELMALYPNLFMVGGSDGAAAVADGGEGAAVAVPGNEPFDPRHYYLSECKECHGKYGDGDPFRGVPAFATAKWIDERSHLTSELVDIIMVGKKDMIGQQGKITVEEARELLDIIRKIAEKYS